MSQTHSLIHMALSKWSECYISNRNKIFAYLKMVKQKNKKYHWEMESQPESIKGITMKMSGYFPLYSESKSVSHSIKYIQVVIGERRMRPVKKEAPIYG